MKRVLAAFLLAAVLLCGCTGAKDHTQAGMELRQKLTDSKGCEFTCAVTADFGDTQYSFTLDCRAETDGTVHFTVKAPEEIVGIEGFVDRQSGKLTFDDTVLTFPLLAQGEIPPVCAPWLFYKALTGGYLRAAGSDNGGLRLSIDDSFQGESLTAEVWLMNGLPTWAEIIWQGRKLLTLSIQQFRIL